MRRATCATLGGAGPASVLLFCVVFQHFLFGFPREPLHSVCLVLIERVLGSVLGGEVNLGGWESVVFSPLLPLLLDTNHT